MRRQLGAEKSSLSDDANSASKNFRAHVKMQTSNDAHSATLWGDANFLGISRQLGEYKGGGQLPNRTTRRVQRLGTTSQEGG